MSNPVQRRVDIPLRPDAVVIFAADIHLKTAWSAKLDDVRGDSAFGLSELLRVIAETKASLIILGGDVWDRNVIRDAELITAFQSFVDAAARLDCRVAAYPGNHDRVFAATTEPAKQWYQVHHAVIDIDNAVFTYGERTGFAMGYCDVPADAAAMMTGLSTDVDSVFLHQNIRGVGLPSFNFDEDLIPSTVDEVYIGDIHMPIEGTTKHGAIWVYPGPMFPQEFGEEHCGVLVLSAAKPKRRGVATWRRLGLRCRPTLVVDATALGPSDDVLADRVIDNAVKWSSQQVTPAPGLTPLINIKMFSSSRQHVAKLRAGIAAQSAARVVVTYAPPAAATTSAAVIKTRGVPPPEELIEPYFKTLRSADGRILSLRRPTEALALLKALFELKPGDETVKSRELAYRAVVKSHLDALA